MSGDGHPIEHVKLTRRAKDLLTEEYPVTETEVYQVKRTWFWEGGINAMVGFVRMISGGLFHNSLRVGTILGYFLRSSATCLFN